MRKHLFPIGLLALTCTLTTAACGDHDSADDGGSGGGLDLGYGGGSGDGGGSGGSGDTGGGGVNPPGPGADASAGGFGWVPFGPSDPTSPTPDWSAYQALAQHQCDIGTPDSDQSDGHLWRALDALCAAAVQGDASQWDVARTEFGAAGGRYFIYSSCLDGEVRGLLTRGLAWHDAHPGSRPDVQFPQVPGSTDCAKQFSAENGIQESTSDTTEDSSSPDTSTDTSGSETTTETTESAPESP